jgi:hypothetical protein
VACPDPPSADEATSHLHLVQVRVDRDGHPLGPHDYVISADEKTSIQEWRSRRGGKRREYLREYLIAYARRNRRSISSGRSRTMAAGSVIAAPALTSNRIISSAFRAA